MENEFNKISMSKLIIRTVIRLIFSLLLISLLIFFPAGSLKFWNAWLFLGVFFLSDILSVIYLAIKDPDLLQKRLENKEKENLQKIFSIAFLILSAVTLILTGLDFKHYWSLVPVWLVIVAIGIYLFGFFLSILVMKQNSYASRVIEIQKDQKVIDTGLYSVIRHPMYLAGILIFCPMPLILGSFYAFILPMIFIPFLFVIRLMNEEKLLKKNLNGYNDYMKRVRYRLIPFIW